MFQVPNPEETLREEVVGNEVDVIILCVVENNDGEKPWPDHFEPILRRMLHTAMITGGSIMLRSMVKTLHDAGYTTPSHKI